MKKRLILFGTPEIAADTFEAICQEHEILAVVTTEDKPQGRRQMLTPSPVKVWAEETNLPVLQPNKIDAAFTKQVQELNPDLLIVVAYGKLFPQAFLDAVPPTWNVHYSLLPRYRGASPVQSAILHGEQISGVSVFQIQAGLDDGPILGQSPLEMRDKDASELFPEMMQVGSDLLSALLQQDSWDPISQQDDEATFCYKITKEDALFDPEKENAKDVLQKIRAFCLGPHVHFLWQGKRLKIFRAKLFTPPFVKGVGGIFPGTLSFHDNKLLLGCQEGELELLEVQLEGKGKMDGSTFGRGHL